MDLNSTEPSPQGAPVWNDAVGADFDVVAVLGQAARAFSVDVGGILMVTGSEGNARPLRVSSGGYYPGHVVRLTAVGSTAYGIILWK